jgi:hypothetical protein
MGLQIMDSLMMSNMKMMLPMDTCQGLMGRQIMNSLMMSNMKMVLLMDIHQAMLELQIMGIMDTVFEGDGHCHSPLEQGVCGVHISLTVAR